MDILGYLQSHPLFATFTPETLAEVIRAGTVVEYQAGNLCIRQGEAGEIFGVLFAGRLEAVRKGEGADEVRLGVIRPGECFGEMSLLTGNPTCTDVMALEKSGAIVFLQEAIGPLLAVNPAAVRFLTRLMTSRLAPASGRQTPPRPEAVKYCLGAIAPMRVLSVSCRRDDMRYAYFDTSSERPLASGGATGLGTGQAIHTHWSSAGSKEERLSAGSHDAAMEATFKALARLGGGFDSPGQLSAIAHRVCHGGLRFDGPAVVDADVKREIDRLSLFAPMENPYNLRGIEACQRLAPGVPQVAVFDTSFHLKMPAAAYRYALPKALAQEAEIRRFGGHGISHESAVRSAGTHLGISFDALRIISCHLGQGASVAAIDHGRSVDTTMGLTPLDGLAMATRCGDLDPGVVLHLLKGPGGSADAILSQLYDQSGLLGLSGISGDVLALLAAADSGNAQALLAVQVFCRRARKYLSAYVGLLGGADVIAFTGGVGQNAPGLRARICQGLEWMGILLDEGRNRSASVGPGEVAEISQAQSRAHVLVVGGNEEHLMARHAIRAVTQTRVTDVMRRQPKPIPINVSAHHVHLTQEHVESLFGAGHTLSWRSDLTQPGQFACMEQVNLIGPKGRVDHVRVLGPVRPESQVEIARTEEFKLGVDAPIRMSGDLDGTPGMMLEGPWGAVHLRQGVICAMRHIHMSPRDAMEFAVRDHDVVRIGIAGERSLIFGDVTVRVSPDFRLDMHVDTDEANAAEMPPKATGHLDSIQERATF